jgi:hypothetical protein
MSIINGIKRNFFVLRAAVALCFSVVLLILFCLFFCYAWFSTNDEVSAVGLSVDLKSSGITATITYYTCNGKNSGTTFVQSDSAELGTYDVMDSTKSYRALIKFVFDNNISQVSLYAVSEAANYLGEYNSKGELISPLQTDGNSVSSIISFYALDYSCVTSNGSIVTLSNLGNYDTTQFVEFKSGGFSFNDKICIAQNIQLENSTLYILLDYNEEAVLDIFGKNLGNTNMGDGNVEFNSIDFYFEAQ